MTTVNEEVTENDRKLLLAEFNYEYELNRKVIEKDPSQDKTYEQWLEEEVIIHRNFLKN